VTSPGGLCNSVSLGFQQAASHVTPSVFPIVGEQRSGLFPPLVPVASTPHTSPFRRQAATKDEAPS
jgi:hypothetical protein